MQHQKLFCSCKHMNQKYSNLIKKSRIAKNLFFRHSLDDSLFLNIFPISIFPTKKNTPSLNIYVEKNWLSDFQSIFLFILRLFVLSLNKSHILLTNSSKHCYVQLPKSWRTWNILSGTFQTSKISSTPALASNEQKERSVYPPHLLSHQTSVFSGAFYSTTPWPSTKRHWFHWCSSSYQPSTKSQRWPQQEQQFSINQSLFQNQTWSRAWSKMSHSLQ